MSTGEEVFIRSETHSSAPPMASPNTTAPNTAAPLSFPIPTPTHHTAALHSHSPTSATRYTHFPHHHTPHPPPPSHHINSYTHHAQHTTHTHPSPPSKPRHDITDPGNIQQFANTTAPTDNTETEDSSWQNSSTQTESSPDDSSPKYPDTPPRHASPPTAKRARPSQQQTSQHQSSLSQSQSHLYASSASSYHSSTGTAAAPKMNATRERRRRENSMHHDHNRKTNSAQQHNQSYIASAQHNSNLYIPNAVTKKREKQKSKPTSHHTSHRLSKAVAVSSKALNRIQPKKSRNFLLIFLCCLVPVVFLSYATAYAWIGAHFAPTLDSPPPPVTLGIGDHKRPPKVPRRVAEFVGVDSVDDEDPFTDAALALFANIPKVSSDEDVLPDDADADLAPLKVPVYATPTRKCGIKLITQKVRPSSIFFNGFAEYYMGQHFHMASYETSKKIGLTGEHDGLLVVYKLPEPPAGYEEPSSPEDSIEKEDRKEVHLFKERQEVSGSQEFDKEVEVDWDQALQFRRRLGSRKGHRYRGKKRARKENSAAAAAQSDYDRVQKEETERSNKQSDTADTSEIDTDLLASWLHSATNNDDDDDADTSSSDTGISGKTVELQVPTKTKKKKATKSWGIFGGGQESPDADHKKTAPPPSKKRKKGKNLTSKQKAEQQKMQAKNKNKKKKPKEMPKILSYPYKRNESMSFALVYGDELCSFHNKEGFPKWNTSYFTVPVIFYEYYEYGFEHEWKQSKAPYQHWGDDPISIIDDIPAEYTRKFYGSHFLDNMPMKNHTREYREKFLRWVYEQSQQAVYHPIFWRLDIGTYQPIDEILKTRREEEGAYKFERYSEDPMSDITFRYTNERRYICNGVFTTTTSAMRVKLDQILQRIVRLRNGDGLGLKPPLYPPNVTNETTQETEEFSSWITQLNQRYSKIKSDKTDSAEFSRLDAFLLEHDIAGDSVSDESDSPSLMKEEPTSLELDVAKYPNLQTAAGKYEVFVRTFNTWMGHNQDLVEGKQLYLNSTQYLSVLSNSIFTICPPGHNAESFRLWEAMGHGSIPIIVIDEYYVLESCNDPFYPFLKQHYTYKMVATAAPTKAPTPSPTTPPIKPNRSCFDESMNVVEGDDCDRIEGRLSPDLPATLAKEGEVEAEPETVVEISSPQLPQELASDDSQSDLKPEPEPQTEAEAEDEPKTHQQRARSRAMEILARHREKKRQKEEARRAAQETHSSENDDDLATISSNKKGDKGNPVSEILEKAKINDKNEAIDASEVDTDTEGEGGEAEVDENAPKLSYEDIPRVVFEIDTNYYWSFDTQRDEQTNAIDWDAIDQHSAMYKMKEKLSVQKASDFVPVIILRSWEEMEAFLYEAEHLDWDEFQMAMMKWWDWFVADTFHAMEKRVMDAVPFCQIDE